ncbi:MAG TPA: hypothetical protein VH142_18105 [Polyangiaceae bacterium]|jgi:hypothetical protein|nr:hypothetical protein [Polyangiaceae bacterium]
MRPAKLVHALWFLATPACFAAPPPSQRVADVARDVNTASRFGTLEPILMHSADGARETIAKRRAKWGSDVRVLDLELTGVTMKDAENATVVVNFEWMRLDEDLLRQTRVEQTWRGVSEGKGWEIVRERRIGGDIGLFGEPVARLDSEPTEDVQFASKTIR